MAHRITSQPHGSLGLPPDDAWRTHSALSASIVRSDDCRVFVVDDVAAYYCQSEKEEWDFAKDFPCVAPPFAELALEWVMPPTITIDGKCVPLVKNAQQLATCQTFTKDVWRQVMAKVSNPFSKAFVAQCDEHDSDLRWITKIDIWRYTPGQPGPAYTEDAAFFFIDTNGALLSALLMPGRWREEFPSEDREPNDAQYEFHIPLLALSFLNCKGGVEIRNATDEVGPSKKWIRRMKQPTVRYHVLDINPMKRILRTEGGIEHNGLKKALHICRGHFVTYTADAPLFGRVTGTFWKAPHVRGNADNGIVAKDYSVKMPTC